MADKDGDQQIEDKSADLGKKVDVPSSEKESIPDYDITELSDDKADKAGIKDNDNEDDARLSKEAQRQEKEDDDHKRLSNREKRQLKKKRVAEKFDAKDALIKQLQDQNMMIAARLNDVDGRLSHFDQAQFTQTWNSSVEAFNAAERNHAEAFSAGDGAAATLAMREMYAAQKIIDQLETIKGQQGVRRPVQQPKHDPRILNKAQAWAERNSWFKPGNVDDDSTMADALAAKLKKEGYDPTTDDYWDELDERLEKKGIGSSQDDDDSDYRKESAREPAKRRGPPVGGGSGGGRGDMGNGKVSVQLPTAFIKTLKDNGMWDDPQKRNRLIKGYLQGVKERGEA